jgi:hypothetical protein
MKKIIGIWAVSVASLFTIVPASAAVEESIVIIDSGFDTSSISENVLEEVCITVNSGCNNGSNLQVGPGASGSATKISSRFISDWNHGTVMAQEAIAINPNINLILIRNSRVMSSGNVLFGGESALESTLRWVSDNADRYNIVGVSMSRGSHTYVLNNGVARKQLTYLQIYNSQLNKMNGQPRFRASIAKFTRQLQEATNVMNALPNIDCPASNTLKSLVSELVQKDIATIFATGNDSNTRYVDSPACIDDAIAVAASDASGKTLSRSNTAPNTDFTTTAPNTSVAAARLASKWSLMYNGSYNSTYNLIADSGSNSHSWSAVFVP